MALKTAGGSNIERDWIQAIEQAADNRGSGGLGDHVRDVSLPTHRPAYLSFFSDSGWPASNRNNDASKYPNGFPMGRKGVMHGDYAFSVTVVGLVFANHDSERGCRRKVTVLQCTKRQ